MIYTEKGCTKTDVININAIQLSNQIPFWPFHLLSPHCIQMAWESYVVSYQTL